ncbi:hypothetical protein EYB53_021185 [Candidatus Chloroploca sp. M-50]|uniref:Polymerase nucleotidyl transferase domain-containing protein n=1 Tax=Candidatus Chloroploca mongolica TaxID=2528176 RepID=A0ABS4DFN3_9CHLR|nr:hypothetical protein [Candidatus Chloroploca mongolica]MBP1468238.1 hypothetical protein [Candidatus Chloroploca mongolica]
MVTERPDPEPDAMRITTFAPGLAQYLPNTATLLGTANLVLHPAVERLVLSGSRGLGGTPRPESDLDVSLIIAATALPAAEPAREQLLRSVLEVTLSRWQGAVECDLAAIFPVHTCGLRCFTGLQHAPPLCAHPLGCRFGIFKLQKGFDGYVPWEGVDLKRLYPILEIWQRAGGPPA